MDLAISGEQGTIRPEQAAGVEAARLVRNVLENRPHAEMHPRGTRHGGHRLRRGTREGLGLRRLVRARSAPRKDLRQHYEPGAPSGCLLDQGTRALQIGVAMGPGRHLHDGGEETLHASPTGWQRPEPEVNHAPANQTKDRLTRGAVVG